MRACTCKPYPRDLNLVSNIMYLLVSTSRCTRSSRARPPRLLLHRASQIWVPVFPVLFCGLFSSFENIKSFIMKINSNLLKQKSDFENYFRFYMILGLSRALVTANWTSAHLPLQTRLPLWTRWTLRQQLEPSSTIYSQVSIQHLRVVNDAPWNKRRVI